MRRILCLAALAATLAPAAQAASVYATSYDMLNGDGQAHGGSFNYWDKAYTGTGSTTTDHAALSGGTGDLTDGVIATSNWFNTENVSGTGPYVGWLDYNPTIDFLFAGLTSFASMTFYFDDSNGYGGVNRPGSVNVNGTTYIVPQDASAAPFAYTVNLAGLVTKDLSVSIFATDRWIFLSEVTFDGAAKVPVPAGGLLLLAAMGGLAALRRRKTSV